MEVHRQTCQACGGEVLNNLVVSEPGHPQIVLVRCTTCAGLVARYELSGYYLHGKGFETFLRTVAIATESSVDLQDSFVRMRQEAPRQLEEALAVLGTKKP